jgi:hypothetical protein
VSGAAGADPYLDPVSGVLRNLLGITDAGELAQVEAALTASRLIDLERRRLPGRYVAITGPGRRPSPRPGSKTQRFLTLAAEQHGPLADVPLGDVSRICTALVCLGHRFDSDRRLHQGLHL